MTLKTRLSKLEKTKRGIIAEADCICFPPEELPRVELRAEMEAVALFAFPPTSIPIGEPVTHLSM
jgi:hypothetical protein